MSWDGLEAPAVQALTGARRVEVHGSVPSVLDRLHELAADGAPAGTLVLAEEQTDGRGRAGRPWYSPPGTGIWMALLLRPAEAAQGGVLAVRAGLTIVAVLRELAPASGASLKWPNDVMLHGRKAGGVLCEARWTGPRLGWVALGVGLNVTGPVDDRVAHSAIALSEADGSLTRRALLQALVPRLALLNSAPPSLDPEERVAVLRRLWIPPGSGTVVGLDTDGALILRRSNGSLERRTMPD